jgi:hypothetical protein
LRSYCWSAIGDYPEPLIRYLKSIHESNVCIVAEHSHKMKLLPCWVLKGNSWGCSGTADTQVIQALPMKKHRLSVGSVTRLRSKSFGLGSWGW